MTAFDRAVIAQLRVKLTEEIERRVTLLVSGTPADYAAYRAHASYAQALRDTLATIDVIVKETTGR